MLYGNILLGLTVAVIPFVPKSSFVPVGLILLFLLAVANGFVGPAVMTIISILAPRNEQGISMGVYQSFTSLARAAGPLMGGALYGIDYHVPYLSALVVYGINVVLVVVFMRKLVLHRAENREQHTQQQQTA